MTTGVLLGTVVLGTLAGYAVARLQFPGRRLTWVLMLLVQMVPFQLLMIPLYVQITRGYGLGDTYLGMILPFAINTTAVFIFAQFFRALPREMFEAARIDGAGELRILRSVALPLVRPALATVVLVTFIGPWNEFLWPFLITKDAALQPLAVSLANYISNVAQTAANPNGAILAGACALAFPVVVLFCLFQRYFRATDLGSAVKG
jgi:multiple sugar transport system permease protein